MENQGRLDYRNKIILAPMVRIGTLPMRLLALEYGADIVYTEELIDWKLLRSVRRINDVLGTVDFVDKTDGTIVFRTCAREKKQVVLQLGTCDPERALTVAKKVEYDVAGVDINMGCPKSFSLKGGMGAALMSPHPPQLACNILRNLVESLQIPVTCKVRVFSSVDKTIRLCKDLEATGISAIAVHGRTKEERPRDEVRIGHIRAVAEALRIPVIANGGSSNIHTHEDIRTFRHRCGTSSIMVARAAAKYPTLFQPTVNKPSSSLDTPSLATDLLDSTIKKYLLLAVEYDNAPANSKYCIQMMLGDKQSTTEQGKQLAGSQTLEQICSVWNLGEYCHNRQLYFQSQGLLGRRQVCPDNLASAADDLHPMKMKRYDTQINCSENVPQSHTNSLILAQKHSLKLQNVQSYGAEKTKTPITNESITLNIKNFGNNSINFQSISSNLQSTSSNLQNNSILTPNKLIIKDEFHKNETPIVDISNNAKQNEQKYKKCCTCNHSNGTINKTTILCDEMLNKCNSMTTKQNGLYECPQNNLERNISVTGNSSNETESLNVNNLLINSTRTGCESEIRTDDITSNEGLQGIELNLDTEQCEELTKDILMNNFMDYKDDRLTTCEEVAQLRCAFIRASFPNDTDLPKSRLMLWCLKNGINAPSYKTEQREKLFQSVVTVGEKKYSSSYWEKNKRFAEQGAALACLHVLGVVDMETLIKLGSIL